MKKNFETILLDEWLYIALMLTAMLWAFGLGWVVGTVMIWAL
jgi:hypothetical protein